MSKRTPHPHVSWRDGRPRFQPDQTLRAAGHKGRDLRHDDGRWFSKGEAVDWSEAFVASLAAEKRKQHAPKRAAQGRAVRAPIVYSVEHLFEDWQRSLKFQLPADPHELRRQQLAKNVYSPKTVRDYRQKSGVLLAHDPSLAAAPVDALSQEVLLKVYEELVEARGLATARGVIAVLSIALAWGRRRGKFSFRENHGVNPARDLGMSMPPPRLRIGSKTEIAALTAAADALGWPEMGDMIQLGLWTGQRQEDRLLLVDKGLVNGRRVFRQTKTGAIVAIRQAPQLERRLKAARERRAAANVVNPRAVLDEQLFHEFKDGPRTAAWAPFPDDGDRYRKRFAELRAAAAKGIPGKVQPCPTLLGGAGVQPFHEADLRATAVTWMAIGGATVPEIIAVTGHTAQSATMILKHYLAAHPEMADTAIGKLIAFYDGDGEAEFGI